jgi:hypothetical protein
MIVCLSFTEYGIISLGQGRDDIGFIVMMFKPVAVLNGDQNILPVFMISPAGMLTG